MSMLIDFEGTKYDFDKDHITIDEWRELKRKYGMTPKRFDETIGEADPDASTFLYWVMIRQAGDQRQPLNDQLKPDIIRLNAAIATAVVTQAEAEGEGEEDPTPDAILPDGTTSGSTGSTTATSATSAASTSTSSRKSAASQRGT